MLAYNKTTLENLAIHEAAEEAADVNLISAQKENEIKIHYSVDLYSPNIFVRIGLGLLTIFIVLSSAGLIGLMTNFESPAFILFLFAAGSFAMLTYMTATKKHFNSGVDHILMAATIIFLTAAFLQMLPQHINEDILASAVICIISLCFFLRFADSIMAFVSFGAVVVLMLNISLYFGAASGMLLSFAVMAFTAVLYFVLQNNKSNRLTIYYSKPILVLQLLALATFYIAGNIYVITEFLKEFLPGAGSTSLPLWFRYFLWAFTALVPIVYIMAGIKYRKVMLCRMGIACVAITILTYRYYYSILPAEAAMILAGSIVCTCSYLLTKYLKQPKGGFIFKDIQRRNKDTANLEGVIIAETFGQRETSLQQETTFGGGSFGGAGAGDRY